MSISKEQAIGKIGAHLICADLIEKSFVAFIVEEGLNYDVAVDVSGRLYRVQVKTTQKELELEKSGEKYYAYRYYLGSGKGRRKKSEKVDVDVYAFVALDTRKIAYIPSRDLVGNDGRIKGMIEFREGSKTAKNFRNYSEFPSADCIASGYGGYNFAPRVDARLTMLQADEIRKKYVPRKYPCKRLSEEYGVSEPVIRQIIAGRTYVTKEIPTTD